MPTSMPISSSQRLMPGQPKGAPARMKCLAVTETSRHSQRACAYTGERQQRERAPASAASYLSVPGRYAVRKRRGRYSCSTRRIATHSCVWPPGASVQHTALLGNLGNVLRAVMQRQAAAVAAAATKNSGAPSAVSDQAPVVSSETPSEARRPQEQTISQRTRRERV